MITEYEQGEKMHSFTEMLKMKNVTGFTVTQIQWLALKTTYARAG